MNSPINIGILLLPSIRSISYLCVFDQLGLSPSEIYWLDGGDMQKLNTLTKEGEKYNYCSKFFDLNFNLEHFIAKNNVKLHKINSSDINSIHVKDSIASSKCDHLIFTGGGIVKKELLSTGKSFIHIHPGVLPEFRGSTCFYYSLLSDNTIGSSAIFLNEEIDSGKVITESQFNINYNIKSDQIMFMDYILDPFIRAYTLKKVLSLYVAEKKLKGINQKPTHRPAYYIMHPVLRHIAIEKINSTFKADEPVGIFEI